MAGPTRLDQALRFAAQQLRALSENPHLDAQILLAHVLERERSWLLAHPEHQLDEATMRAFHNLVERLLGGEALPYVTGERWFYGRKFSVEPTVLIPRPETELLVESALDFLRANPDKRCVADIGTGSGCIAVTLCAERQGLKMFATDLSHSVIEVARRNAWQHAVEQYIHLWVGDLLHGVAAEFDLICANLPYIPRERLASLGVAKREPRIALDGGEEGLDLILTLMSAAENNLRIGGRMVLEIDESQGKRVTELARSMYPDWSYFVTKDLADLDRVFTLVRES